MVVEQVGRFTALHAERHYQGVLDPVLDG